MILKNNKNLNPHTRIRNMYPYLDTFGLHSLTMQVYTEIVQVFKMQYARTFRNHPMHVDHFQ